MRLDRDQRRFLSGLGAGGVFWLVALWAAGAMGLTGEWVLLATGFVAFAATAASVPLLRKLNGTSGQGAEDGLGADEIARRRRRLRTLRIIVGIGICFALARILIVLVHR